MVFHKLEITDNHTLENTNNLHKLNDMINSGSPTFIFFYKDGCPPCINAKPSWKEIHPKIKAHARKDKEPIIALINKDLFHHLTNAGPPLNGYPTFRFIHKKPNSFVVEEYENSRFKADKDRSTNSFNSWVEHHMNKKKGKKTKHHKSKKAKSKKATTRKKR
jgi:thiol-disulfide isomerase/thioredoxin|tara:strand:+ start:727 stop:1212 length:486 start_codon:yes stop_codon:yes gene_type:complete